MWDLLGLVHATGLRLEVAEKCNDAEYVWLMQALLLWSHTDSHTSHALTQLLVIVRCQASDPRT